MKMKLSHLKENRLTNYVILDLWKSFNRTDVVIIIKKKLGYVRLFYLRMCSKCRHDHVLGTSERAPLSWRPPSTPAGRGVCWHLAHVLFDTETQLLQAAGLVAVDAVLAGSPKAVGQRVVQDCEMWGAHCLPQQAR